MYILAAVLGIILAVSVRKLAAQAAFPHQWICPEPGCWLSIRTNKEEFLERVVKDHNEKFHPGKVDAPPA